VLNGPGAGGLGGGPTTRAPHEPAAPAVPPVLRPRPKVAVTESPPAQPITGATALQDGAKETKDNESMPPSMYEYFHGAVWQRKKLP